MKVFDRSPNFVFYVWRKWKQKNKLLNRKLKFAVKSTKSHVVLFCRYYLLLLGRFTLPFVEAFVSLWLPGSLCFFRLIMPKMLMVHKCKNKHNQKRYDCCLRICTIIAFLTHKKHLPKRHHGADATVKFASPIFVVLLFAADHNCKWKMAEAMCTKWLVLSLILVGIGKQVWHRRTTQFTATGLVWLFSFLAASPLYWLSRLISIAGSNGTVGPG